MKNKMINQKSSRLISVLWCLLITSIICFLSFNFYPIVDDLVFAGKLEHKAWSFAQIATVCGVNGRYLGNTLGVFFSWLSTTQFWFFRAIFNAVCMVLLFYYIIKYMDRDRKTALFLIPICMLVPNVYHFNQYYGFSADFMNYLLPLLLLFINFYLVKQFLSGKEIVKFIVPFIVFLNCFFIEHITVYIACCCFSFLIYCIVKKQNLKFSLCITFSAILGLILMFLHSFVYNSDSGYRGSALSQGVSWIVNNITDNISYVIFDHLFLTGFISLVLFLCLIKYTERNKIKVIVSIIITAILCTSCICSFCLYFGNWEGTVLSLFCNKYFTTVMTFLFLISIGLVLKFYIPEEKVTVDVYLLYISIWFICAILSTVTPIGPRCFMIVYAFLSVIIVKIYSIVSELINVPLKRIIAIGCTCFLCLYMFDVCSAYKEGNEVMKERFTHIEAEMEKKADTIEISDTVNFTDSGGLDFLDDYFYYQNPGDIKFIFIQDK